MGKILTIIPARSGSKRVKNKNTRILCGKPLIQWTIEAALGCELSKNCYVSTNCENIASLSKDCGAKVPFLRPNEFATDESPTYTAIQHMISKLNGEFEFLVLLQPTSPLRTSET